MPRAFIIGAGCSRNYAQSESDITGLLSPLDYDFFRMAKKVVLRERSQGRLDELFEVSFAHLLRHIRERFGGMNEDPLSVLDDPNLGLEKVMTTFSIEKELFDKPVHLYGWPRDVSPTRSRMSILVELIARTFAEALKGPVCDKHKALAELMASGDIVLSYNYDLLMDNALMATGKLTDEGYRLSFFRVFDGTSWTRPDSNDSSVTMLKLHGSLNWIRCSICDSNLLLRGQKIGAWPESLPGSCPKCGASQEYIQRLIVPPLQTKNYADPSINYLWLEALRALGNIKEVVVIGYSLPTTDFASEALLRNGLSTEIRNTVPIKIVNPDKDKTTCQRFSNIFSPDTIEHIESLDEYIKRARTELKN